MFQIRDAGKEGTEENEKKKKNHFGVVHIPETEKLFESLSVTHRTTFCRVFETNLYQKKKQKNWKILELFSLIE